MRAWIVSLGLGLGCAAALQAYLTSLESYHVLTEQADAIVIAVPVGRRELPQPAQLPGVKRGNEPIAAVEIRTEFLVLAVLTGNVLASGETFEFQHFREAQPPTGFRTAGPMLIDFNPRDPRNYLMFLKKRPQGSYEAVNPVEPAWCVEELSHPVERPEASPLP